MYNSVFGSYFLRSTGIEIEMGSVKVGNDKCRTSYEVCGLKYLLQPDIRQSVLRRTSYEVRGLKL